jgi:putative ATPase
MNLFENNLTTYQPLAERMRPRNFDDFIGHEHIIGPQTLLRRLIDNDELVSLIFWAPPGSGKTTLARMIAHKTQARFVSFSAVTGGVKQLREEIKQAHDQLLLHKKRTILFVDEIHRFNKSQQDYFLPFVENGTVTLIGATTENPSFEVNSAL